MVTPAPTPSKTQPTQANEPAALTIEVRVAARRRHCEAHLNKALKLRPDEGKQAYTERVKSCLQSFRQDPYTPYVCRLKVSLISILINLQLEMHAENPNLAFKPENQNMRLKLVSFRVGEAVKQIKKILEVSQNTENREELVEVGQTIQSFFQQIRAGIREKGDIVEGVSAACVKSETKQQVRE